MRTSLPPYNLLLVLGLLLLTCCEVAVSHEMHTKTPEEHAALALPFEDVVLKAELVDQHDNRFSLQEMTGRLVLLNFIFTSCTDICPVQTMELARVRENLKNHPVSENIELVSVSIDPAHDTSDVLLDYAKRHQVNFDNWSFASGTVDTISLMERGLWVGTTRTDSGTLNHRSLLYMIGPDGRLLQRYRGEPVNIKRVTRELKEVYNLFVLN